MTTTLKALALAVTIALGLAATYATTAVGRYYWIKANLDRDQFILDNDPYERATYNAKVAAEYATDPFASN